jgi:hypothetical protein
VHLFAITTLFYWIVSLSISENIRSNYPNRWINRLENKILPQKLLFFLNFHTKRLLLNPTRICIERLHLTSQFSFKILLFFGQITDSLLLLLIGHSSEKSNCIAFSGRSSSDGYLIALFASWRECPNSKESQLSHLLQKNWLNVVMVFLLQKVFETLKLWSIRISFAWKCCLFYQRRKCRENTFRFSSFIWLISVYHDFVNSQFQ